jgi:hypothetical protein
MRRVRHYLHVKNQTAASFFKEAHRWKYGSDNGYHVHLLRYEVCGSIAYFIGEYLDLKEKEDETFVDDRLDEHSRYLGIGGI